MSLTLAEWLRRGGAPVELPCGGRGVCLKCRAVVRGAVAPPDARERALLTDAELVAGIRYACMARVLGDDIVVEPLDLTPRAHNIQTEGAQRPFAFDPWGGAYGLAADIGTTTVAAYLYDLKSGARLAETSAPNPQAAFGADVTSRIDRALAGEGPALARAVRGCLGGLLGELCARTGVPGQAVETAVVTGNTAMLYFLTGRDPASIATAPFDADCLFGGFARGGAVGLPRAMRVYLPACVGAYVGADITTALIAAGFNTPSPTPRLLVDIGTNGEMALALGDRLLCCSTAAGPALEGAGISCGMTARTGAVRRVFVEEGRVHCDVIGGGEAEGICGSGLIDAVAAMLRLGALDETGRLEAEESFPLPGTRLSLTQWDIRAVQLAKAAVSAGVQTLLFEAGLEPRDVGEVLIAGGFGSHIDPKSAGRIGLLPDGLAEKACAIGNAAGIGASMVLRSGALKSASERLPGRAKGIELSTHPVFAEAFIERMYFSPA